MLIAGIAVAVFIAATTSLAQTPAEFIYGKVYTRSSTYEGQIRWGSEEAFWTDIFNASKKSSGNYQKIAEENKEESSWQNFNWDILSIWENKSVTHQFSCQFGDIKELKVLNKSNAQLLFKNGIRIEVNGDGYNDIGTKVQVLDKELGWTTLIWDKIDKVEFSSVPKGSNLQITYPIYGTIETTHHDKFRGYIQWDTDERVSTDKLDGDSPDGRVSVAFSEITAIEKRGNGSDVTFKSGRTVYLKGSNDVGNGHRGVLVVQPGKGIVKIPWSAFRSATFSKATEAGPSYESFVAPKQISGTVYLLDSKELSGKLVYDVDEAIDMETLEGNDNEIEYTIPFRNIKSIKPKNNDYSMVELKTGETLLLGDRRDVSYANDGILIFTKGKKDPVHVRWRNIDQIIFD
ncbi:hypothetical protein WSM22_20700 [Cytophagales bacterium WSM2-2]|nr:hypothetical protein WSM22_20700 [Cytophagales bacterium WSM2-2]